MPLIIFSIILTSCFKTKEANTLANKSIIKKINDKDSILSYSIYSNDKKFKNWEAPKRDSIIKYINDFESFDLHTWNQCFGTFNCGVRGKIRYNNSIYDYNLNAGGWVKLKTKSTTKILGSRNKRDTINKFISVYYCDEDWD